MTDVGFDEFTLTLIQSGLMIEELNHTGSCIERFIFNYDGLPPYTTRCHWWILGVSIMILMIDHSNYLNQKSSGPSKEVSMMSMMRSRHVSFIGNSIPKSIISLLMVVLFFVLVYEL